MKSPKQTLVLGGAIVPHKFKILVEFLVANGFRRADTGRKLSESFRAKNQPENEPLTLIVPQLMEVTENTLFDQIRKAKVSAILHTPLGGDFGIARYYDSGRTVDLDTIEQTHEPREGDGVRCVGEPQLGLTVYVPLSEVEERDASVLIEKYSLPVIEGFEPVYEHSCETCDGPNDDGEGYDGDCGTCADRKERAGVYTKREA